MRLSERRVTHSSPEAEALLAFVSGENGADRRVLELVAKAVIDGFDVNPHIQRVANVLLAKALLDGRLPVKASGRPKQETTSLKGVEITNRFYELLDGGMRRDDALIEAADYFKVEPRQVERAVERYRWLVGHFLEDRERFRAWRAGTDARDYEASVLIDLRIREKRPPVARPTLDDRLTAAPAMLDGLRTEFYRVFHPTAEDLSKLEVPPLTIVDGDDD